MMFKSVATSLDELELVDNIQRLGVAYHFKNQIEDVLRSIYHNNNDKHTSIDLYTTALRFRLLRQHGFHVSSQETFGGFELLNLKTVKSEEDYKGMLSLYEASFLVREDENDMLQVAREHARCCLESYIEGNEIGSNLSKLIEHALELPLHWRVARLESRWFIDLYESNQGMNPLLLELAKLDFNYVQATHLLDLQYVSRWWNNIGINEKLSFSRDRIVANFLWTIGVLYEPQFGYYRRMATKVNAFITTIDDIYDVYGTLDELQLFTQAIERWDVNAIDQLPYYMKICFLALHNSITEISYDVLKEQGYYVNPYLKKVWGDLCKSYLVEAKWYYTGYTPKFEEYTENACISISATVILVHGYFLSREKITEESLQCLMDNPEIIRLASMIIRLAGDLGTSSDELKRGDVLKSVQCYMNETGVSEKEAREHIQYLIEETWKKINREQYASSPLSRNFINSAINLARMAQCMYQYGDGHGIEDYETKDRILSLLIQPIPI